MLEKPSNITIKVSTLVRWILWRVDEEVIQPQRKQIWGIRGYVGRNAEEKKH